MRTLVIGYDGEDSGHGRYCRTFVAALKDAGEDIALHSLNPMPKGPIVQLPGVRHLDRTVRTIANAMNSAAAIRAGDPRIVHFQMATPIVDRWWISRLSRRRACVMTVHNVEPHEWSIAFSRTMISPLLRAMDALVVHSASNKKRLEELFIDVRGKVFVIPHGVWGAPGHADRVASRTALQIGLHQQVVLFFGVIRQNKGLDLLLHAMSILKKRTPTPPLLVVAGEAPGPDGFEDYARLIHALDIADCVKVQLGRVPESGVASYYSAADVVALPYEERFQAQSGVLFDAYAHGVPVVVSDVGGIGESVRKDRTGIVLARRSAEDLADALHQLLNTPSARDDMRRRMSALADGEYSWKQVAAKTRAVYSAVERRPRPT